MDKIKFHTPKWFVNRIGKRIYRYTNTYCCKHCQKVLGEGLVIYNLTHAHYLYDCQNEMNLKYGDKPLSGGRTIK